MPVVSRLGKSLHKESRQVGAHTLAGSHLRSDRIGRASVLLCVISCLAIKVNEQMLLPPAATAETTIEADNALQPPYTVA
jgi:hypothetical protein